MHFAGFLMPKKCNQQCFTSMYQVQRLHPCYRKPTRCGHGQPSVKYVTQITMAWETNVETANLASFLGFLNGIHLSRLVSNHANKSDCSMHLLSKKNTENLMIKIETTWFQCRSMAHVSNTLAGFLGFLNRLHMQKLTVNFVNLYRIQYR